MTYQRLALLLIISIPVFSACNEEEDPNVELQEQLDNQIEQIENYLAANNITAIDTNGYFLEVITENPSGDAPVTDNILSVYYEIQTLEGSPIATVSESAGDFPTIVPFNDNLIILPLSLYDLLSDMRTGEEVRVFLPFNRAYNNYELPEIIPAFSPIILQLRLDSILTTRALRQLQDTMIKSYLADNSLLPADSLAGGVYYYEVEAGQAPEVKSDNNLEVRYTGRMLDGYLFDSNVESDSPLQVNIDNLNFVPGFETALLAMSEGEKGVTVFPADQGYGANLFAMPDTVSNDLQARRFANGSFFGAYKPIRFDLEVESVN